MRSVLYSATLLAAASNTMVNGNAGKAENLIAITGIIVTAILGIISSVISWKLGSRSIKQTKISYKMDIFDLLSYTDRSDNDMLRNLKITYGEQELTNPSLLVLKLENVGNASVSHPPISVRCKHNSCAQIFAGAIKDIPPGYENLWTIHDVSPKKCDVQLEHFNPRQTVRAVFLLDNCSDEREIELICPMPDLIIIKGLSDNDMYQMVSSIGEATLPQSALEMLSLLIRRIVSK